MDVATVREIVSVVRGVGQKDVLEVDGVEPSGVYYLRKADGSLERTQAKQWPRNYSASRVQDVVDIVRRLGEQEKVKDVAIFCAGGRITAVLDETKREDVVELFLPESAQFKFARNLGGMWAAPKDMIASLRVQLAGCVPPNFISWLRQLKFSSSSQGDSDVQVGKESMGRSIQNQVSGAGDVPESVRLEMPVYEGMVDAVGGLILFGVECVVDINYMQGQVRLVPVPSSVLEATRKADEWLVQQLRGLEADDKRVASVFCGKANVGE